MRTMIMILIVTFMLVLTVMLLRILLHRTELPTFPQYRVKPVDNYTEKELCEKSDWCQIRKRAQNNGRIFVCQPLGGLGNQLFVLFSIISLSKQTGCQFRIISDKMEWDKRPVYWNVFLKGLKPYLIKNVVNYTYTYTEPAFEYKPISDVLPYIESKNQGQNFVMVSGYFQSAKYFENQKDYIIDLLKIPEQREQVSKKISVDFNDTVVSMHFRIGDYAEPSTALVLPLMKIDYYMKALTYMNQSLINPFKVLYFYERNNQEIIDGHISKLTNMFPHLEFIPIMQGLEDWEELLAMSCCHHNIIPNSTFGWWGAYLNSNPDKIVCYPSVWFGPVHEDENTDDLCPETWTKIDI